MKKIFAALPILILCMSCNPKPNPIIYGEDKCDFCRMTIVDRQHAAEAVTGKGKVFKFDAIECMVHMRHTDKGQDFQMFLVNDFLGQGELLDATSCTFLISEQIPSPMGAFLSAFTTEEEALRMQKTHGGDLYTWEELQAQLKG